MPSGADLFARAAQHGNSIVEIVSMHLWNTEQMGAVREQNTNRPNKRVVQNTFEPMHRLHLHSSQSDFQSRILAPFLRSKKLKHIQNSRMKKIPLTRKMICEITREEWDEALIFARTSNQRQNRAVRNVQYHRPFRWRRRESLLDSRPVLEPSELQKRSRHFQLK